MRILCVNHEPITLYHDQGWSLERLARYYNPGKVAERVLICALGDREWTIGPAVQVRGFRSLRELDQDARRFSPDVIRCYEAVRPFADWALRVAGRRRIPSYLSLHNAITVYHPSQRDYTVVTGYTDTAARRAERMLGRPVEVQLNGIDDETFAPVAAPRIDPRLPNATIRVFTIGRPDPVKNVATAVEATRLLAERGLSVAHVIGGPGSEQIEFDGVHLGMGPLTEVEIAAYLTWSTCFLQVQRVSDIGMAAAEALVLGRPVVHTADADGNALGMLGEQLAVLVPSERVTDPETIAEAVLFAAGRTWDHDAIRRFGVSTFGEGALRTQEAERYRRLVDSGRRTPRRWRPIRHRSVAQ